MSNLILAYTINKSGQRVPMCPGCTIGEGIISGGHRCNYILQLGGLLTTQCNFNGDVKDCRVGNPNFPAEDIKRDMSVLSTDIESEQAELETFKKYCEQFIASC